MHTSGDDYPVSFLERTFDRMPDWSIPKRYEQASTSSEKIANGVRFGIQNIGFYPIFTGYLIIEGMSTTVVSLEKMPKRIKESSIKKIQNIRSKIDSIIASVRK